MGKHIHSITNPLLKSKNKIFKMQKKKKIKEINSQGQEEQSRS